MVDIHYEGSPARAVSRAALARVLHMAAQAAGVRFSLGHEIESLTVVGSRARATTKTALSDFDLFAIADGAASSLRESTGIAGPSKTYRWGALWGQFWVTAWPHRSLLLQRFRGTSEMMGLLPTEIAGEAVRLSFFWSIRGDRYAEWKQGDLDAWKRHVLNLWPEAAPVVSQIRRHDDLAFAKYRHTWPRSMGSGPLCVVGDAAHAMSPQLGLGTTLAMEDALALAYAVEQCGAAGAARKYSSQRLRRSQGFQTLSRLLTPCFQAQGQGLWRDVAFATGLHIPGVPWLMKRSLAAPARSHPVEAAMRASRFHRPSRAGRRPSRETTDGHEHSTEHRVVVVGGYGFFGRRLVERLALQPGIHVTVAGRSLEEAQALVGRLRPHATARLDAAALDAMSIGLASGARTPVPDHRRSRIRAVPRAGLQGRACVHSVGANYIDLADARAFVVGIEELDSDAKAAGVFVSSGASSVPALSSAAVDHLARGMSSVRSIDIGISPGNRTERGLSTVKAILSYCGKPIPVHGSAQDDGMEWVAPPSLPGAGRKALAVALRCPRPRVAATSVCRRTQRTVWRRPRTMVSAPGDERHGLGCPPRPCP